MHKTETDGPADSQDPAPQRTPRQSRAETARAAAHPEAPAIASDTVTPTPPGAPLGRPRWARLRRALGPVVALGICVLLLLVFQRLSRSVDYRSVVHSLRELTPAIWAQSLAATALSYLALIARDAVGLRFIGAQVPRAALCVGATVGSAIGNATGFGALTGGAVRCRVYGVGGVQAADVGRLTVFTSVTLALSLLLMTGAGMLLAAPMLGPMLHLPRATLHLFGGLIVLAFALLLLVCRAGPRVLRVARFSVTLPSRGILLAQAVFAVIDVLGAGLALWALLPHADVSFGQFIALYAAAMLLGMIGHTPGGIGVFQAAMVFAFGRSVPAPVMVAALLAYRAIYFGAPLLLSVALLVLFEGRTLANRLGLEAVRRVTWLVPATLSMVTFLVGIMLVISGATPAYHRRLDLLERVLPLWVLEGSQLLASVMGVLLLFVARGLLRRLDASWWLALGLALVNLLLSLAKGLAFVEVGVLSALIVLLLGTRHHFSRSSSLFAERFTFGWLVSVGSVLLVAFWIMGFAFRDVPYNGDLLWQFAFDERAPRALRATLLAALVGLLLAVWQMLRPAAGRFVAPPPADLLAAADIIRTQVRSDAVLAMMGDKSFLFWNSRNAFLMYAKRGRTWAALHDPVGPREDWAELISRFVALAHSHGGRAAFYQVRADALPLYLDARLALLKLGEEAHIDLRAFDMKGSHRANLRYAIKRAERDALDAKVVGPDEMAAWLPTLRRISDAWLTSRSAREKSFSVAAFTSDYLAAQSAMVVRQNGEPVTFVTFMTTGLGIEATIGVMRHLPEASPYTMEYLFTQLALHLKESGFHDLSLGMAPLSGMQATPLASLWHRFASFTWQFGGRFYNFQGLRLFKNKFQPRWEPRYLAASGSVGVFFTLADLSLLAGGKRS